MLIDVRATDGKEMYDYLMVMHEIYNIKSYEEFKEIYASYGKKIIYKHFAKITETIGAANSDHFTFYLYEEVDGYLYIEFLTDFELVDRYQKQLRESMRNGGY